MIIHFPANIQTNINAQKSHQCEREFMEGMSTIQSEALKSSVPAKGTTALLLNIMLHKL